MRPASVSSTRHPQCGLLFLGSLAPANAALVDRTYTVTATNTGGAIDPFVISFSLAYDTLPNAVTTTGITLISASAGWSSTLGYVGNPAGGVIIGGTSSGIPGLDDIFNDVLFTLVDPGGTPSVATLLYTYSPALVVIGREGASSSVTHVENQQPGTGVPEPAALGLLGLGMAGLLAARWRRGAPAAA